MIAISQATRQELIHLGGIEPDRISAVLWAAGGEFRVVEDRAMLEETALRLGLAGKRFLLFVGQPTPRKNVPMLMRVFLQVLRARREPVPLVLVGPPYQGTDMNRLCGELGYTEEERKAVIVTGAVSDADLVALYNLAHALVFPTLYEGFGLTVLEAMACGLPVISSNASSIPEVAGDAGLLLDPTRDEGWADAIHRLLDDPALHAECRRRGLERAPVHVGSHGPAGP